VPLFPSRSLFSGQHLELVCAPNKCPGSVFKNSSLGSDFLSHLGDTNSKPNTRTFLEEEGRERERSGSGSAVGAHRRIKQSNRFAYPRQPKGCPRSSDPDLQIAIPIAYVNVVCPTNFSSRHNAKCKLIDTFLSPSNPGVIKHLYGQPKRIRIKKVADEAGCCRVFLKNRMYWREGTGLLVST